MYKVGQEVALFTKEHFVQELTQLSEFKEGNYPKALTRAFLRIDELLQTPEGQKELSDIAAKYCKGAVLYGAQEGEEIAYNEGCTACMALITKTEIYIANSGDSRCVMCKNGNSIALSTDHKPELEEEKKRIEKAGGNIEDGRVKGILKLSRALGDIEYKRGKDLKPEEQMITAVPEIKVEKIVPETEFLIIASSGVWECYKNARLIADFRSEIWDSTANKPIKTKLSRIISNMLDSIIANDTNNEGKV